jgi:hypothetical protein
MGDERKHAAAVARGQARWAGSSAAERSIQMSALAKARAAKLSRRRRAEIAAAGGRAGAGARKPGSGRRKAAE